MKKLFNIDHSSTNTNIAILMVRVVIAALMLTHGIPKLSSLLSGDVQFPPLFGLSATASLALAVFAEVVCSLFILAGFGTRLATIPLIITMLVAVLYIHAPDSFSKQELGLLYLLPYAALLISGSGKFSIDYLLQRRSVKPAINRLIVEDPTREMYQ
jgi:putative oxidoreductase